MDRYIYLRAGVTVLVCCSFFFGGGGAKQWHRMRGERAAAVHGIPLPELSLMFILCNILTIETTDCIDIQYRPGLQMIIHE